MNKKILILFTILSLLLINTPPVLAQTVKPKASTPVSTPTGDIVSKLKQIEALKEKIATKVAEIRDKDKKVSMGSVKSLGTNSVTITSRKGEETITYSDDTTFYYFKNGEKTETNAKKIVEGDLISVFGYLSEDKTKIVSKYIYIQTPSSHIIGKLVDIDKDNFILTIKEKQGNQLVDVETSTKTFLYSKSGWQKGGFSKFKLGDSIHVVGTPDTKDAIKITGNRIYILPQISQGNNTANPSATPSGSKTAPSKAPTPTKKAS